MSKKSAVRRHRKTLPLGDRDLVINDSEAAELYGVIDPGRESLPAPSHQRERPPREGARQAIENRQGTERSEEHTSELQSLMRISYAVFCLKKKQHYTTTTNKHN